MTITQLSDAQRRLPSRPPYYLVNGIEMKKLGISSRVLFLTLLAGFWTWSGSSASERGRRQAKAGVPASDRREVANHHHVPDRPGLPDHPERGDVPGWVMITLMSAVLVAALLALAGPALEAMFNQAMDKVGS
jgi:hypothetical protein